MLGQAAKQKDIIAATHRVIESPQRDPAKQKEDIGVIKDGQTASLESTMEMRGELQDAEAQQFADTAIAEREQSIAALDAWQQQDDVSPAEKGEKATEQQQRRSLAAPRRRATHRAARQRAPHLVGAPRLGAQRRSDPARDRRQGAVRQVVVRQARRRLRAAEPPCVKGRLVGAAKGRLGPVKGTAVGPVTEKVGRKGMVEAVVKGVLGGSGRVDC